MIKTATQAVEVQNRRFNSGKKGTSAAVRRFYKRVAPNKYEAAMTVARLQSDFTGCRSHEEAHKCDS